MRRRNYSSIWRGVALAVDPGSTAAMLVDTSTGNNHADPAGSGNLISPYGTSLAVQVNGSGRYVTPIVRHGIGTGNYTISCWVTSDSVSSAWRCIWTNGNSNVPAFYATTSGGSPNWGLFQSGTIVSGRTLVAGEKTHICARRINGNMEFFTNGIKESTSGTFSGSMPDAASVFFSESSSSQVAAFSGCIRDFFLHSRALTEAEIRVLAIRCGIVYEMTNRHDCLGPTFQPAWIRHGSRIIGGGVF